MTEKLYYENAYTKEFTATVLSCECSERGYLILLDRSAFFPEEGGQSADTGTIASAKVIDAYERNGDIIHVTDIPIAVGNTVECKIDFTKRFEKMQMHTAEHILCGIIHSIYGYENTGFHLGDEMVTFDVSGVLSKAEIDKVEQLSNNAVFESRQITAREYSAVELANMSYRAKLDSQNGLRIVEIEGVDKCACCAPHVSSTAEVGIIKIVDFERHRGGTRIYMLAGARAYRDLKEKYDAVKSLSGLFSVPKEKILDGAAAIIRERDSLNFELKRSSLEYMRVIASLVPTDVPFVLVIPFSADVEAMREYANEMTKRTDRLVAVIAKNGEAYKYVIAKRDTDISLIVKKLNSALLGRGGGRGFMASGSFCSSIEKITSEIYSLDN